MLTRRSFITYAGGLVAATSLGMFAFAEQGPALPSANLEGLELVNPQFRAALEGFLKSNGEFPTLSEAGLSAARQQVSKWALPPLPNPQINEFFIPGPSGAPKVRVLVTGSEPNASKPAILHIHGGGYVIGSVDMEKRAIQQMALDHDCVVVSVDYRLAPATRFPGSLEDNYAALRWLHTDAKVLGVDVTRIAIKGESAGGGHAAALAIAARDRGEFKVCFQVLIYPMLDDRTGSVRKLPPHLGRLGWSAENNRFGWTSLLGVPAGSANVPKNSVPARISNFAGLPPAFIGVGSLDLFAPEDIAYANSLVEAGVSTELFVVPGATHGFDMLTPDVPISREFRALWSNALRQAFTKA